MKSFKLSVDAGNISIISKTFADKYGVNKTKKDLFVTVKDVTGLIKAVIQESYLGEVECSAISAQDNETYYVGDACYIIKNLDLFIQDTDNMKKMPLDCDVAFTGGDGLFLVTIEI